jgi:hypothetical protein
MRPKKDRGFRVYGDLCRPYGTHSHFPLYPGLRYAPSWANFTSTPSGFNFRGFYSTSENKTEYSHRLSSPGKKVPQGLKPQSVLSLLRHG